MGALKLKPAISHLAAQSSTIAPNYGPLSVLHIWCSINFLVWLCPLSNRAGVNLQIWLVTRIFCGCFPKSLWTLEIALVIRGHFVCVELLMLFSFIIELSLSLSLSLSLMSIVELFLFGTNYYSHFWSFIKLQQYFSLADIYFLIEELVSFFLWSLWLCP